MSNKVYISSTKVIAPGISENESISNSLYNGQLENLMEYEEIGQGQKAQFAHLSVSKENPLYPNRSDLKVMRNDVLGLTVCLRSLSQELTLTDEDLKTIPLHIANGASIDHLSDQLEKLAPILSDLKNIEDRTEKNRKIFKTIPPLLALRTLTNAAQSFASQYTQIRGGGTTFGVTSLGGFYALKEAYEAIKNGEIGCAIVASSHLAGPHSYLSNSYFNDGSVEWRESSTAVCLFLESEESLKQNKRKALAEILDLKQIPKTPTLKRQAKKFDKSILDPTLNCHIYGGAQTFSNFQNDAKTIQELNPNAFSFFPYWGNTGPSSLLLSIALACEQLAHNNKSIQCIDYDSFARNFSVSLNSKIQ